MDALPQTGVVWSELMTTDLDGAEQFYKEVVNMSAMRSRARTGLSASTASRRAASSNRVPMGRVGRRVDRRRTGSRISACQTLMPP